jgi:hypothetical protein
MRQLIYGSRKSAVFWDVMWDGVVEGINFLQECIVSMFRI